MCMYVYTHVIYIRLVGKGVLPWFKYNIRCVCANLMIWRDVSPALHMLSLLLCRVMSFCIMFTCVCAYVTSTCTL